MGWLVLNGALPWGETRDSYLRKSLEELTKEARAKGYKYEVRASTFVGSVWYAAVHVVMPAKERRGAIDCTTAFVFLTKGTAQRGFGYKDMNETDGPVEDRCPRNILDMLSPVEQLGLGDQAAQWASEWRARCRART